MMRQARQFRQCDDLLRRVYVPRGVRWAHVGQDEIARADGLSRLGILEVRQVVLDPACEGHARREEVTVLVAEVVDL